MDLYKSMYTCRQRLPKNSSLAEMQSLKNKKAGFVNKPAYKKINFFRLDSDL